MFLGLLLELAGGTREVTWLRDHETWAVEQDYGPRDGANVETRFSSEALGLDVRIVDALAPDADLFARITTIIRSDDSPVTLAWLLTYANLSPTPPGSRIPQLPIVDWALDGRNDYAPLWDAEGNIVVHFHPDDQRVYRSVGDLVGGSVDWGPVGAALSEGLPDRDTVASLLAELPESYADGVYLLMTTVPAPDQHQIGYDRPPSATWPTSS